MKKLFFVALAAAMAGATALTSCGSDDNNEITPATRQAVSGNIKISAHFSEDFIKCCDINFVYTDDQGKEQKISMASMPLKDTVVIYGKYKVHEIIKEWKNLPLPTTIKYHFTCELKDNLPAQDSITLIEGSHAACTINYNDGTKGVYQQTGLPGHTSVISLEAFKDKLFALRKKALQTERIATVE